MKYDSEGSDNDVVGMVLFFCVYSCRIFLVLVMVVGVVVCKSSYNNMVLCAFVWFSLNFSIT